MRWMFVCLDICETQAVRLGVKWGEGIAESARDAIRHVDSRLLWSNHGFSFKEAKQYRRVILCTGKIYCLYPRCRPHLRLVSNLEVICQPIAYIFKGWPSLEAVYQGPYEDKRLSSGRWCARGVAQSGCGASVTRKVWRT